MKNIRVSRKLYNRPHFHNPLIKKAKDYKAIRAAYVRAISDWEETYPLERWKAEQVIIGA